MCCLRIAAFAAFAVQSAFLDQPCYAAAISACTPACIHMCGLQAQSQPIDFLCVACCCCLLLALLRLCWACAGFVEYEVSSSCKQKGSTDRVA
jgi:hypothetical protein